MTIPITTNATARQSGILAERQRIIRLLNARMQETMKAFQKQCEKENSETSQAFAAIWIELDNLKHSVKYPIIEP